MIRTEHCSGYSLLEVIVVVAILGLAATISGPSIGRMVEQHEAQRVVRSLQTDLSGLRLEAFTQSRSFESVDIQTRLEDGLPVNWEVEVNESLTFNSSGACLPGDITLQSPTSRRWTINVRKGDCFVY